MRDAGPDHAGGVVVVTGGTSGIGRAVVDLLLAEGWPVAVFDINADALAACTADYAAHGDAVRFMNVDITREDAVDRAIETVEVGMGAILGLVNSAGIGKEAPFLETSAEMFRKILEVNLLGSFIVARCVAARMAQRGQGAIINIASVSGLLGNSGRTAYGASKGGVVNMTRVMAVELAKYGVRINAVAPGPIETSMVATMHSAETRQSWLNAVPQHRYGSAEEAAHAVLFLVDGRKSSYITGQTICVDGGFTIAGLQ